MKKFITILWAMLLCNIAAMAQTPITPGGTIAKRVYTKKIVGIDTTGLFTYSGIIQIDSSLYFLSDGSIMSRAPYTKSQVDSIVAAGDAIPTLQEILTSGNVSTLGATVDNLTIGQGSASYLITYPSNGVLRLYNDDNGTAMQLDAGNGFYQWQTGSGPITGSLNMGAITGDQIWSLPDASGTVALSSGYNSGQLLYGGTNGQFRQSSNLFYDSANIKLGVGTLSPLGSFHVVNNNASLASLRFETNIAASTTTGATIYGIQDDGTVMQAGEVLVNMGAYGNRTGSAGGIGIGGRIKFLSSGTWTPSSTPANILFETTSNGSSSSTEALQITSSKGIHIYNAPVSTNGIDSNLVLDGITHQIKIVPPTAGKPGVTDGSDAALGNIGEYIARYTNIANQKTLTTATVVNIDSITLQAGDWELSGYYKYNLAAANTDSFSYGFSLTSATLTADTLYNTCQCKFNNITGREGKMYPNIRFNIGAATKVYFIAAAGFSGGDVKVYGYIRARRVR